MFDGVLSALYGVFGVFCDVCSGFDGTFGAFADDHGVFDGGVVSAFFGVFDALRGDHSAFAGVHRHADSRAWGESVLVPTFQHRGGLLGGFPTAFRASSEFGTRNYSSFVTGVGLIL